jgi:hypothetical protein
MASIRPKFTLPTGYENEQLKAERKRKIAQALLERGLASQPNMQSWAQVLGQMAQAGAGSILNKRADKMDEATNNRMLSDYHQQLNDFQADVNAGMDPAKLVEKYGGSPMVADALKPYGDAMAKRLTERENLVNFGGRAGVRVGDVAGQYEPSKPNDPVIRDAQGNWTVNPVRETAALGAQGFTSNGQPSIATYSMPNPYAQSDQNTGVPQPHMNAQGPGHETPSGFQAVVGQIESGNRDFRPNDAPTTSSAGALYGMQVMPSTAHNPGFGVTPAANESAAEYNRVGRDYATAMQQRYGDNAQAFGAYNAGPGAMDRAISQGGANYRSLLPNETRTYINRGMSQLKPPAGVANGKPYWMINGVPYDNPEGF